jgi:hypothetical protein
VRSSERPKFHTKNRRITNFFDWTDKEFFSRKDRRLLYRTWVAHTIRNNCSKPPSSMFNTKATLLLLAMATCSNARCKRNEHLRHGPPLRPDPSLTAAIHSDLIVYGRPDCPEQFHKDLQDEIAFALNIDGSTTAQVVVLPYDPHPHGPPHGGRGGPPQGNHGGPHHDGKHYDGKQEEDVKGCKAKIHEQCKEDEAKFCAIFQETWLLGGCMHKHLDEVAINCKDAILKYDPQGEHDKGGWGWAKAEDEEVTFRVIVFATDETQADELRQLWAAMQPELLTETVGKAQEVKVNMSAMAMSESAASEVEWMDAHHPPPHHHGQRFLIGALVCALAAAVVVAFRQRRRANSLQARLDYEMQNARNLATPTLAAKMVEVARVHDVVVARKESLLDNAAAGAPQMPEAAFANPISMAAL